MERSKTCVDSGSEVPKDAMTKYALSGEDAKRNSVGRSLWV